MLRKVRLHTLYNLLHQEQEQPRKGSFLRLYNSVTRTTGEHPVLSQALPTVSPYALKIAEEKTQMLPSMPKQLLAKQPRITDKFNLHEIGLANILKERIVKYYRSHGILPEVICMTSTSAFRLAQAGFCHEGHFCFTDNIEILIIPDETIMDNSDIYLDHNPLVS
jgi:hypothetical protein